MACGIVRLCLANDHKYFMTREVKVSNLWQKLEEKAMEKSYRIVSIQRRSSFSSNINEVLI